MSSLIIIGCGPGGYATAEYAAKAGISVTIFEKAELGGTCLNRGCIPTKVYCHIASVLLEDRNLASHGIIAPLFGKPLLSNGSFRSVFTRKESVVSQLRTGIETLMSQPGITLVRGTASLKDTHTVTCNGTDYHADNIIIATGSHPTAPPIPGIDGSRVLDSTGILALQELPKSLVIIGAGVIGMEMASAFNAFGTEVTVIEFLKECLPMADSDLAKRLRKILEKRGIKFYMQAAAKSIGDKMGTNSETSTKECEESTLSSSSELENTVKEVTFEQKGKTLSVDGDVVLCATGRGPNTSGLGLDDIGITYDRHGIHTDDNLQTNIPDIYAIGDVNGKMQLAHAAEAQGRIVVDHILGRENTIRLDLTPWAVFTTPELAGIGPTESQLKAGNTVDSVAPLSGGEGLGVRLSKSFYRANGKAVAMDATDGMVKILSSSSDGKILACHILGAHAADLVQEVTALINMGATISDLESIIHIHPTLQELL